MRNSTHKPRKKSLVTAKSIAQALTKLPASAPASAAKQYQCSICQDVGYLRYDLPTDHADFGKLQPCQCKAKAIADFKNRNLFSICQLDDLYGLRFENFNPNGLNGLTTSQRKSVNEAFRKCNEYAKEPDAPMGWLLLVGTFGCGKTHLAAAIANFMAERKHVQTLFVTVPALLDQLRNTYDTKEQTFTDLMEQIQAVQLLVLDDFGAEQPTDWAKEKLFQILNRRYISAAPTVITSNLAQQKMENLYPRIYSRVRDSALSTIVIIEADDQRTKKPKRKL